MNDGNVVKRRQRRTSAWDVRGALGFGLLGTLLCLAPTVAGGCSEQQTNDRTYDSASTMGADTGPLRTGNPGVTDTGIRRDDDKMRSTQPGDDPKHHLPDGSEEGASEGSGGD